MFSTLVAGKIVAADPEVRTAKSGKAYTTAKIAVGQDAEERLLVSIIAFGDTGEALARLKKNDEIAIAGRASVGAWLDKKTSEPKGGLRVVADQILTAYQVTQRRAPAGGDRD